MLAGALGVGAQQLASLFGDEGEPIVLGILVFLLGKFPNSIFFFSLLSNLLINQKILAYIHFLCWFTRLIWIGWAYAATASTFSRFFPRIKARYDYGVLIFILTFSLVAVSGYRVNEILELAHQRLSTILVGGATCIIISIFVCPVWAGEDLHKMIVSNMEKLASFFEGTIIFYLNPPLSFFQYFQYRQNVLRRKTFQDLEVNILKTPLMKWTVGTQRTRRHFFKGTKVLWIQKAAKNPWWVVCTNVLFLCGFLLIHGPPLLICTTDLHSCFLLA